MWNCVIKFIYKFKTCKKTCKKYVKYESEYLIENDILYYNIVIKPMKIKKKVEIIIKNMLNIWKNVRLKYESKN